MQPNDPFSMFEFMYWLRDRALSKASELASDEFLDPSTVAYRDLRSTLVHELDVERSWRLRLQGAPKDAWDVTLAASDYRDVAAIASDWQREEAETLAWLADLSDVDVAASITANGLEGFPLSTYLIHVVMHGVESLSAAAILLHRAGHPMGDVGFLDFVDATGSQQNHP
jgi:uncharacterized damage-inducible protein DinB